MTDKDLNNLVYTQFRDIVETIRKEYPDLTYITLSWCDDEDSKFYSGFGHDNGESRWNFYK